MASHASSPSFMSLAIMLATTPILSSHSSLVLAQEQPVASYFPTPIFTNTTPTIVTVDDGNSGSNSDSGAGSAIGTPSPNLRIVDGNTDYKYAGCYSETTPMPPNARALEGPYLTVPGLMSVEKCINFCSISHNKHDPSGQTKGYRYAGLEFARECWCGDSLSQHSFHLVDSACDTPCDGANTTACGGHLALTLYNKTDGQDGGDGGNGGNGGNSGAGNGGDGEGDGSEPGNDKPPADEAVLQAVGMGVLVLAVTFALSLGCL